MASPPVLALCDPNANTVVLADACSYVLGAVLLQEQENRNIKAISYISRSMSQSMSPAEDRYTQIENEALALTWVCKHFSDFLIGLKFSIQMDHKLLIPLFSTKQLEELLVRVQRFRLRMLQCDFTIAYTSIKRFFMQKPSK